MSPAGEDAAPGGAAPAPPSPPGQWWDDWPPSTSPLLAEFPGRAELAWTLAGRRATVSGSAQGVGAIEIDGERVAADVRLTVNGAVPAPLAVKVAPDEVVRVLQAGEIQLTERVTTALEHPIVFWSLVADVPVRLRFTFASDLAVTPLPADDIPPNLDGRDGVLVLGREGDAFAAAVAPAAGSAQATADGVLVTGDRLLRVVLAAGTDTHALDRVLETLRRRKLRAFRQDRVLHARRLEERLVAFESPEPALDRRFRWAKVELDSRLEDRPGAGRRVAREPARTARALLAAGDREVVRDLLRAAVLRLEDAPADPSLLALVDAWLRWTGDLAPLAKLWPLVAASAESQAARLAPEVRDRLAAAAHAAGEHAVAARVGAVAATGPVEPPPHIELTGYGTEPAGLVSGVVETLWGLEPDLIRGEVRVAPGLPHGWQEMALRRVRVGPTSFDLRLRRRPERTVLAVRRVTGPPIRLRTALRDDRALGPVTVDQVELGGREATFLVEDVHEVAFHDG